MRTHKLPSYERKSKIYPSYASQPGNMVKLISSKYPCLEHIFMVPKVFQLLKFYCTCFWVCVGGGGGGRGREASMVIYFSGE